MLTRREFLRLSAASSLLPASLIERLAAGRSGVWVNDVHSQLNPTRVAAIVRPRFLDQVRAAIREAGARGEPISVAGARHAAGGQQFASGATLIDMSEMKRILHFDPAEGTLTAEAGIRWPELERGLRRLQERSATRWAVAQKQGVPLMSLGGTLSANAHGNAPHLAPIVGDVDGFDLVDARGRVQRCSRTENQELFRLAIGGYGLFGVITAVRLRLTPRRKLESAAELVPTAALAPALERWVGRGVLECEFQADADPDPGRFMRRGVLIGSMPAAADAAVAPAARGRGPHDWLQLALLAHADPRRAFEVYSDLFLAGAGRVRWSDEPGSDTVYVPDYHQWIDAETHAPEPATEILVEYFMPRAALGRFLEQARAILLREQARLIFSTVRLVERDSESFLGWARWPCACVVFNLHVVHAPESVERAARTFRRLVDLALSLGGTYYLTYHGFATRAQVERAYPTFRAFLGLKLGYDPEERFQSDWYRRHRGLFAAAPGGTGR